MAHYQFAMSDRWKPERDLAAICEFMRQPEIYWAGRDRLDPQPEQVDLENWLIQPDCCTYVASYGPLVIGYAQFLKRTSIAVEMQVAYSQKFRGLPAKRLTLAAMADVFLNKGVLKIMAFVASDNRVSIYAARHIGMQKEGELTNAIVRESGIRNLLVFCTTREQFLQKGAH